MTSLMRAIRLRRRRLEGPDRPSNPQDILALAMWQWCKAMHEAQVKASK